MKEANLHEKDNARILILICILLKSKFLIDLCPHIEIVYFWYSGLKLDYESVQAKGNQLLIKNITAEGDVGSHQGKNYNLQVTMADFETPTQSLKIRLQPGM